MSVNLCGSCMMCCKVMAIPELDKADGEWCRNACKGIGCKIYEARPQRCQDFLCGWRKGFFPEGQEPPELRPDRCHVVFAPGTTPDVLCGFVDPAYPEAWRKPLVLDIISQLADKGVKVVLSFDPGPRKRLFMKQGSAVVHRWIEMSPPDENGIQWFRDTAQ